MSTSDFGEQLRLVRVAAGMSQRELAAAADMSVATVRDLEQGRSVRPRQRSVEAMITALGVSGSAAEALRQSCHGLGVARRRVDDEVDGPLRIEVLGPLVARRGSARLRVGVGKRRIILARLALTANVPVSAEELVDLLWGRTAPATAISMLQVQMSRLRTVLAVGDESGHPLPRTGGGYTLVLADDALDLVQFRRHVDAALVESGAPALDALDNGLRLCRGGVLADVPDLQGHALVERAVQDHIAAAVRFADLAYRVGEAARCLPYLESLTAAHPLHEPLQAQLIRALAAVGRRGEALHAYEATRRRLADELGIDPGDELRQMYLDILRGRTPRRLGRERGAEPARPEPRRVPSQLPGDIDGFTGRGDELTRLDTLLAPTNGSKYAAVPVVLVCGTAGVGKTTLAVRWARSALERYPDGQLYVNVRGYDHREPLTASAALAAFLRALGVDDRHIPLDVEERAAQFRSEVSGRRMLFVVDNAATIEQVRPLLPGSPGCAVVVTSRDSLPGLVVQAGAHRLELGLLAIGDATALLRGLLGERADAEPDAVTTLALRCARLPLALRIAAELAASHPHARLEALVTELAGERRLDRLDSGGDQDTAVTAVFSWSLRHLPPTASRVFTLLGQHPGAEFDAHAVAALAGMEVDDVRRELDRLRRAHLLEAVDVDRYEMHDLLRAFAARLAPGDRPAIGRLLDFYLATTAAAAQLVTPAEVHFSRRVADASAAVPLPNVQAAVAWLDRERPNLVSLAGLAAHHGWPAHAMELSVLLFRHLDGGGHLEDASAIHRHAAHAASLTGDHSGLAQAHLQLGFVDQRLGRTDAAREHLARAIAMFRAVGDLGGESRALTNLGGLETESRSARRAIEYHLEALELARRAGDRVTEAGTLTNLGGGYWRLGEYEQAAACQELAVALFRAVGDGYGEAIAMTNLSEVEMSRGRIEVARVHLQHALALAESLGYRLLVAAILTTFGGVESRLGRLDSAVDSYRRALDLAREGGDMRILAITLNRLGEAVHAKGDDAGAQAFHREALDIATGYAPDEQARAFVGLGRLAENRGDWAGARRRYTWALDLYRELGSPTADLVTSMLDAIPT